MTNRSNFLVHLVAAFLKAVLCAAHTGLALYHTFDVPDAYRVVLASASAVGSLWLFFRMVIHCIAAVGREVDQQRRQQAHAEALRKELDESFERALSRTKFQPPLCNQPRIINHRKTA